MRRFHFTLIVTTVCLCLPVAADKPVPASLKVDGTKLSIQWQSRVGAAYQLQGSNDSVNWKNHGGIRVGPTANSAAVGRDYKYYRVLELKASVNTNQPSKDTARKTPAGRVKTSAGNAPAPRTMSETEAKQLGLTVYKAFLF